MNEVVNPPKEEETPKTPEELAEEKVAGGAPTPAPGSKTPPELLLKSLQEEREKRKELEDRIELLEESSNSSDDFSSDEGRALQRQIKEQDDKIAILSQDLAKKDVLVAHPVLKEKWEEFETFRADPENKGMNLRTAVKAFLVENDLFDPVRKGLEQPTGGARTPVSTKMTGEEIKTLRETNYKLYEKKLKAGEIVI